MRFVDRRSAGRQLAGRLSELRDTDVLVLGLPRGGVPVAAEVATALGAPLDVIVVRKLGVPTQPELAMGAIGENGVLVVDDRIVEVTGVTPEMIDTAAHRERMELERQVARFRQGRPPLSLDGRVVVIVDDGFATGSTARAACQVARAEGAARVILAVPVAPEGWEDRVTQADEAIAVLTPANFQAVGQFYENFDQVSDREVVTALSPTAAVDEQVHIPAGSVALQGDLVVPADAPGLVIFAHGSGSSRTSPRNRFVAEQLRTHGLGTLLFDLLTPSEEQDRANVFDVELLGRRLVESTTWLRARLGPHTVPIGYFGASTGAAAALWAAATPNLDVRAVVSRGGRPDLAGSRLAAVDAPTLLLVGELDQPVIELNRQAAEAMPGSPTLEIIPGASHLFSEPGTLEIVAGHAALWFGKHLTTQS